MTAPSEGGKEPTLTYHGSGEDLATDVHALLDKKQRLRFMEKWQQHQGAPSATAHADYKALYHELLFAVASAWPHETRHQTALRYIQQAERGSDNAQAAQEAKP